MDVTDIKQQIRKFQKARHNLLAVIAFTVINIFLIAINAEIAFLFSASLPQLVFEVGLIYYDYTGLNIYFIMGLIIAIIITAFYFIFWILAKRVRAFILAALIFFSIDALVFIYLIFSIEFHVSTLFQIAFHGWILYYLIIGVIAWSKMRGVSAEEYNAILDETDETTEDDLSEGETGETLEDETTEDETS